jgi:hypothetical protein
MGRRKVLTNNDAEAKTRPDDWNVDEINFNNVTKDKKGCGFRHEEFPELTLTEEERERYLFLIQRSDEIQKLLYNIPCNLSEFVINLYIKNIVEIRIDNGTYITRWWEQIRRKYDLPCSIKYNAFQNKFYRHITDDDKVTDLDRINN